MTTETTTGGGQDIRDYADVIAALARDRKRADEKRCAELTDGVETERLRRVGILQPLLDVLADADKRFGSGSEQRWIYVRNVTCTSWPTVGSANLYAAQTRELRIELTTTGWVQLWSAPHDKLEHEAERAEQLIPHLVSWLADMTRRRDEAKYVRTLP